jgi:alkyldihydroxyacetonephosphate synthase
MRRWNGWGDEDNSMQLPDSAGDFLAQKMGAAERLTDCGLTEVLAAVPASRLPKHPLISDDKELRVRHARGQSLPDWLAMRSGDFGIFPDGVCFPENRQQVQEILSFAKQHRIELISYGGGTSVAGHINPNQSERAVLTVDMSHMNQLMHLDESSHIATFGAGTPGPMVEAQLRARGYTLGHFPQSFELSTIGGWVASRSSGQQSLRYGRIEQLFAGGILETFDGVLELPTFPASSAGPDLREMILGSEGRFGIISEVKVRISKLADKEQFYGLFFPDWQNASDFCRQVVQNRVPLSMLRVSNAIETQTQLKLAGSEGVIKWLEKYLNWRGCGNNKCMLTLGITGSSQQLKASLLQLKTFQTKYKAVSTGTHLGKRWAAHRFQFPYLREALWLKGYAVDTVETATDWCNVPNMMNQVESHLGNALFDENEKVHVFTHLSHVYGQGCSLYTTYLFRCADDYQQTLNRWKKLKRAASETIVNNRGTISHQHGVGKDHAPYLSKEKGEIGMQVIDNLCQHFDPQHQLNPGTLIDNS